MIIAQNINNLIEYLCLDVLSYSIPSLITKNQLNVNQSVLCGADIMNELVKRELEEYFQIDK